MKKNVLVIQSSARGADAENPSVTREVISSFLAKLSNLHALDKILVRECETLPNIDSDFVNKSRNPLKHTPLDIESQVASSYSSFPSSSTSSTFLPIASNHGTPWQLSCSCCEELLQCRILIIAAPCYNFSIPASLKAWIDLCSIINKTFKYEQGEQGGPKGMLYEKKVFIFCATGGMVIGSAYDYGSRYLRHMLNLWGVRDLDIVYYNCNKGVTGSNGNEKVREGVEGGKREDTCNGVRVLASISRLTLSDLLCSAELKRGVTWETCSENADIEETETEGRPKKEGEEYKRGDEAKE